MQKRATVKTYNIIIVLVVLLFFAAIAKMSYVVLSDEVDGVNLKEKSASITTASKTLYASRGSIYDVKGETLATTINSYTLIAYLSSSRTTNEKNPQHVVDKDYTAKQLATVLDLDEATILKYLSKNAYQVEFGAKGKGLTEVTKQKIEALDLPGLDFITSTQRYYNMSTFASYIVGYAKMNQEGELHGELGVEGYFNDTLAGKNGYTTYQKYTSSNYQIPNTPSHTDPAVDGSDIFLTIDSSVQLIAEKAVKEYEQYNVEWAIFTVMDAKTGAIVASATNPNFNPNDTNTIKSYMNPLVSYQYEPGSVMKVFSFASAIEEGIYKGDDTFESGSIDVADVTIRDANKTGWGTITYDTGFAYSSNVAATKLALELGISKLSDYYHELGFGKKTGIELANEVVGDTEVTYKSELASASFGQGVSVTPIQMLQALSSITNNGEVLKPYIVDKIVDSEGKTTYEGKRTVVKKVYSAKTTEKMKELMKMVVYDGLTTMWRVEGLEIMGKTGTAQIASPQGGYLTGTYDYIKSFAGIFPAEDPKYIVYVAAKQLEGSARNFADPATNAFEEIAGYAKLINNESEVDLDNLIEINNYISKNTLDTVTLFDNKKISLIVLGNGKYIINQFPLKNSTILANGKLFLLTNSNEFTMPNVIGWSRSEVETLCKLINLNCIFNGYGYVNNQSIPEGTIIDLNSSLTIDLIA